MAALGTVICCGKSDLTPAAEDNNGGQEQQSVETTLTLTSATSLQFSTERASVDVEFTCSDNWKARILPEGTEYTWVTAYPHSGKAGSGKVNISVTANNTLDAKAATLEIVCNDKKLEVPIAQEGLKRLRYNYKGAELLPKLAATYDEFIKNDLMPSSFTIENEGITETLSQGKYYEAMCLMLPDLATGNDDWKTKTYALLGCGSPSAGSQYETFAPDKVSLEQVLWINDKQYTYAKGHNNNFANYCTVDGTYFSFTRSLVVCARLISAFAKDGSLPSEVSSWQSDFLRDMNYDSGCQSYTGAAKCSLSDPVVTAARDAAIVGKTTTMEKAVALFNYARDQWEWLDYANTRRGAVKVINSKEGNCCDLAHALIAMSRSAGIPARYVHGPETYYPSGNTFGHVWAELYVDGKWYTCDASNNGCTFGTPMWILEKSTIRGKYKDLPF